MNGQLELKVTPQHRIVLNKVQDDVMIEVESLTNAREKQNWGLLVQLRLEPEHQSELLSYLLREMEF